MFMKKIIKIFLFLFLFFIININALAIGISKNEITNDINRNHYELVVGDYLCVYKAQDESEYVAIKFEKINSSRYNVIFYVDDEYANSYIFNDFGYLPENLKYDDGVYLTSAPNCSDYVFYYYTGNDEYYTIYSIDQIGGVNNIEKDDMIFDESLSILGLTEDDDLIINNPSTNLYIIINNEKYYYVEDTDYVSHFESATGVWACYVETVPGNEFSYVAKNIPLDFDFDDKNLVVEIDSSINPACNSGYVILEKTPIYEGNGSSLENSGENINFIDKLVPYPYRKNVYVQVYSNSSGVIVQLNGNERIAVKNSSKYKSIYQNKLIEEYPKYLIYTNNNYYFSNYKTLEAEEEAVLFNYTADIKLYNKFLTNKNFAPADQVYISLQKLFTSSDSEEVTLETCQVLLSSEFLEFLNNNIFKIIYIGIPIILILLTSFDFAKVVFINDKEGIQKAGKRFGKRVVVAILIFLVPTIIIFISNMIGADQIDTCVQYFKDMSETY